MQKIAVKIFSILPSEICDERTASRLGWFNAARHSSILPENLVNCARLYDYYKNGISEGEYTHTAHVELDEVLAPSGQTARRSAPSLMDLVHEENISPSAADQDALEDLLFNHPDPFDLAETERVDFSDPPAGATVVTRSQTVFAIGEYIKLDSAALAQLLQPSDEPHPTARGSAAVPDTIQAGKHDDWSINDFI